MVTLSHDALRVLACVQRWTPVFVEDLDECLDLSRRKTRRLVKALRRRGLLDWGPLGDVVPAFRYVPEDKL